MKRILIGALTAGVLMVMPVTDASAQPDRGEVFSAALGVTGADPDPDPRVTPNGKWVFFEGTKVTAAGEATIGTSTYDAVLEATLSGKLSPDGTKGFEMITFTLTLDEGDLVCDGTVKVKRYAVADGLFRPYGESGKFRADCDGAKVMGEFVGEPPSDGTPGFFVTMDGTAR